MVGIDLKTNHRSFALPLPPPSPSSSTQLQRSSVNGCSQKFLQINIRDGINSAREQAKKKKKKKKIRNKNIKKTNLIPKPIVVRILLLQPADITVPRCGMSCSTVAVVDVC